MENKKLHPLDLEYVVDSFNEIFIVFSAIEYTDLEHLHTDYCKVWYGGIRFVTSTCKAKV